MADDDQRDTPRRTRRSHAQAGEQPRPKSRERDAAPDSNGHGARLRRRSGDEADREENQQRDASDGGRRTIPAGAAARRAATEVAELTGRDPESVISIERRDGNWRIGVEVVETRRIPDSADVLATYEVELQPNGRLVSYRRVRRYARGQMDRDPR